MCCDSVTGCTDGAVGRYSAITYPTEFVKTRSQFAAGGGVVVRATSTSILPVLSNV
jgi:hypothetical protein